MGYKVVTPLTNQLLCWMILQYKPTLLLEVVSAHFVPLENITKLQGASRCGAIGTLAASSWLMSYVPSGELTFCV